MRGDSKEKKKSVKNVILDRAGVDEASDSIRRWLEEKGIGHRDISRIRLTVEEMLLNICDHSQGDIRAELSLSRHFGTEQLCIRYGGGRFDPRKPADNEMESFTSALLTRTGILPVWRWRLGQNELLLRVSAPKKQAQLLLLACIVLAVVVGLLGQFIPVSIRNMVTDYGLSFLSDGFLHLLNTFIGMMIFLTVITGICGIGSAAALGRVGRQMITRFLTGTFLICAAVTAAARLFFPLAQQTESKGSGFLAILNMIFGILPSNPVQPFMDGNTLQIVFMAVLVGIILLITGSQTENLRNIISEAQAVVMRCVKAVCMLLPFYIFSSLVRQLWTAGPGILIRFWRPLVVCILLSVVLIGFYLIWTCWRLKVKPSVLVPKLLPVLIIGLTTSSSAAAFAESMDINETKLGIDKAFSRMGFPVGSILFAGSYSMLFVLTGVFMAECHGIHADAAWWVTIWIVCSLLSVATPPVAGGNISCLSVLLIQLHIPPEGLAAGVALAMFLDFICTGTRIPILHMELALQADRLGLIDHEVLRNK
ncbi:MAG: cation:dicarboxylase symporter family transporter [Lachnospiraceae bacterium]|nr:cation:dicarboxylase symporter family transporter [Lachnospiraceae bacterium]